MNRFHRMIEKSGGKPLLGAAMYFYDPIFLEIASYTGFNAIWIEMEHAPITFAEAADLCRMASGSGMLTMIRIPDARRENVLKAAECGPDIIDLPMANSPEMLKDLVKYARFAPEGVRGSFGVSRAVQYGIVDSIPAAQQELNQELSLLAQIETAEAVERIEDLCLVPGVDIFIGPSDLSASLGVPGETSHPKVIKAAQRTIEAARNHGKKIAVAGPPADYAQWVRLGADLLFCTNDIACLKLGARSALEQARQAIANIHGSGSITSRPSGTR